MRTVPKKPRFYRATVWSAKGTATVSFEADTLTLAWDHAAQLCAVEKKDLVVWKVKFIGHDEPTEDFGVFRGTL